MANSTLVDSELGVQILDESGLGVDAGETWAATLAQHPEVAAMVRWTTSVGSHTQSSTGHARQGNLFERDRFITPASVFDQFRVARDAVESDDVCSEVADSTEAMAFNRMSLLAEDEDEQDIWNQLGDDVLDLDSRYREMWRELYTYSQFYACVWWGTRDFKVRGRTKAGNERRKHFPGLRVPTGITLLDPLKIVPIGGLAFGQERLAYIAEPDEKAMIEGAIAGDPMADPLAARIMVREYTPPEYEARKLAELGITPFALFEMNPQAVFRHTLTRPSYSTFASVRMKSVFELLDMKQQLRQMDRTHLIGGSNFIVLIKKGTDQRPAQPKEVRRLQAQVRTLARLPVIVGDHRLAVEIVTPKTDNTLEPKRYDVLDNRIKARLYQMFMTATFEQGSSSGDDSVKVAMVVARGMESRRKQLRRAVTREVILRAYDANDSLTTRPKQRFHPARISLSFDSAMVQFLIDARDRGDVSRETYLAEIELIQEDEAILRKREADRYDKTFKPTIVPFAAKPGDAGGPGADTPEGKTKADPKVAGRTRGGTKQGGGAAPGSGQGQAPRRGRPKDKP